MLKEHRINFYFFNFYLKFYLKSFKTGGISCFHVLLLKFNYGNKKKAQLIHKIHSFQFTIKSHQYFIQWSSIVEIDKRKHESQ
ncbi:unnamed protein product [Paramecium pentaurelia]|uniref:Uncharacterized protein n=1 Tax=Paramecium pentaurelia TaxID=43138 RepID=A0A8S1WY49_9CILI|nr:unnamed protein product [Paramecium pentaurelia]CAD8193557.1 unnamed protein product [Paramecium pentaurelia]CAD8193559.1 unnamed protein product [Paramecium pentaurelia]CAD8193561.1 unnamed protein product [Paramecium pentaurelia]